MVFEQIYPLKLIERHWIFAFLLGLAYTTIGIGAAAILFPGDPSIVAVAFTSLMMLPTLSKLLKYEEEEHRVHEDRSIFLFFKNHRYVFGIYSLFFLGVLLTFSFFSIMLPAMAKNVIFKSQIDVLYQSIVVGRAVFNEALFFDILLNNFSVLALCFIVAFLFGDGAIFLITWNASVWGTIFGAMARNAGIVAGRSPVLFFVMIIAVVFPHMILEVWAYISAGTSGSLLSRGVMREKFWSDKFKKVLINTLILVVFSVLILLLAVTIETHVLGNSILYREIIRKSFSNFI